MKHAVTTVFPVMSPKKNEHNSRNRSVGFTLCFTGADARPGAGNGICNAAASLRRICIVHFAGNEIQQNSLPGDSRPEDALTAIQIPFYRPASAGSQ